MMPQLHTEITNVTFITWFESVIIVSIGSVVTIATFSFKQ